MLISIISLIVVGSYFILISSFHYGWRKIKEYKTVDSMSVEPTVSVVIVCKNEEVHLPSLFNALKTQADSNVEIILVDDHSTDSSAILMRNFASVFPNCKVLSAENNGKKAGLKQGITDANGQLIITTDADCTPPQGWIRTIRNFAFETNSDLIICPVALTSGSRIFSQVQSLEFTSLIISGAGAAGIGTPILCNGANLAFKKSAWLQSQGELHDEQQSGDDIFLLESIKRRKGIIRFLKSVDATVTSSASDNIRSFFKQRRRWAAKSTAYTDKTLIATACIILGISLMQIISFVAAIFNPLYWFCFGSLFLVKYTVDACFLQSAKPFFCLQHVWFNSFLLSLTYPIYISVTAISSLAFKPKKWK